MPVSLSLGQLDDTSEPLDSGTFQRPQQLVISLLQVQSKLAEACLVQQALNLSAVLSKQTQFNC